ncbi:NAD(P)-binding protein [Hypomontagnella submonticulosa]|nr:NAD(P)-binding protein [Hypomontagnella submonticulosa]
MAHSPIAAALQYIGAAFLTYEAYKLLDYASFYLLPPASLARYRAKQNDAWALITGASAGIGLGTAQELAVRGFNVVLLGHLPAELEAAAALIKSESRAAEVRIVVLDAITATPHEIEAAFESISDLPITILVNNVGGFPGAQPAIRNFADFTGADLDRSLNINARFMAHVSRIMLPRLADNSPALVLNMSSAARLGIPGVAPYSGCKGFIISLTSAIAREMSATGKQIDCLSIIPGDVRTQSNNVGLTPGSPDARQFAKVMLDRAPRAVKKGWLELRPWLSHAVSIWALDKLPGPVVLRLLLAEFEKKRKAAVAKAMKED